VSQTSQDARVRRAVVVVLVLAPLVATGTWLLIWAAIRVGHDVLPCDGNCPPGARFAETPSTGIVVNVFLGIMIVPVLRLVGLGIALGLGPLAAVVGWYDAVANGRVSAEAVSGSIGFWRVVAIVGAVFVVLGVFGEFRLPGPLWRLFGWVPARAELDGYTGPPKRSGIAVVAFTDRDGVARRSVVPARHEWMELRVKAWYRPRDPSRVRIAPSPVGTPKHRDAPSEQAAPSERMVAPGLAAELDRLATMRRNGQLNDAQYEFAKRRLLGR
jgi:hypothetical protein